MTNPSSHMLVPFLCALAIPASACAPEVDADDVEEDVAAQVESLAVTQHSAHVDGLTVWIDTVARPITRDGRRVWVLKGRASKDLDHVFSFVPDDPFGTAELTSARKFELVLDSGSEVNSILSGLPLFVRVTARTGEPAFAAVWMAPRFARFSGSSKLSVKAPVAPVWVAGQLVYRGRATSSSPYASLLVSTPDDAAPAVVAEGARRWKLDWSFDRLVVAADPPTVPVTFTARSAAGATVSKTAGLDFAVTELGLTRGDPYEVWATVCEPEVKACLAALPPGQLDTEACGTYRQVNWCGGLPALVGPPDAALLAQGLRNHLAWWYESHAADVAAGGGNSLAAAQAAVDPAKFEPVLNPADDPHGHDLAAFRVFRHPDPVFPGSDTVWFSVWDRASGASVDNYSFQ